MHRYACQHICVQISDRPSRHGFGNGPRATRVDAQERDRLRTIADYQFGAGAGEALFPADGTPSIQRSASGRVRQVKTDNGHLVSVGTDGRFTLGIEGGRRLQQVFEPPRGQVVVGDESAPYVREGRSTFAKFVKRVDSAIRPRDEVLVVHEEGHLLGVGRAQLDAASMQAFDRGVAVQTRAGVDPEGSGDTGGERTP